VAHSSCGKFRGFRRCQFATRNSPTAAARTDGARPRGLRLALRPRDAAAAGCT
jgi:hypothetical protein